jgi:LPS sulfotransferase NodH
VAVPDTTFPWPRETPYQRFIILSGPRTGSNLLAELLNSHPDIRCFRELFNTDPAIDYGVEGYDGNNASDVALRARAPASFLATRVFTPIETRAKAIGFKFHYQHSFFHEGITEAVTADADLRIVHLSRRNLFRQYVSHSLAERTDEWTRRDARSSSVMRTAWRRLRRARERPRGPLRLRLVPDETESYFWRQIVSADRFGNQVFASHPRIELTYEDLDHDRVATMRPVWDFLGVPVYDEASSSLTKQNPRPLREIVANYDDLKERFAAGPFSSFFDE